MQTILPLLTTLLLFFNTFEVRNNPFYYELPSNIWRFEKNTGRHTGETERCSPEESPILVIGLSRSDRPCFSTINSFVMRDNNDSTCTHCGLSLSGSQLAQLHRPVQEYFLLFNHQHITERIAEIRQCLLDSPHAATHWNGVYRSNIDFFIAQTQHLLLALEHTPLNDLEVSTTS